VIRRDAISVVLLMQQTCLIGIASCEFGYL
jgi:hypothetical protein